MGMEQEAVVVGWSLCCASEMDFGFSSAPVLLEELCGFSSRGLTSLYSQLLYQHRPQHSHRTVALESW